MKRLKENNLYINKLIKTWKDAIDKIPKVDSVLLEKVNKAFENLKNDIERESFDVKPL